MLKFLSPRWRKVLRDLWDNKPRTILVVMSIAVGVFAFGSVFITQQIIIEDLNSEFVKSNPASILFNITNFDEELVLAVEDLREVEQAEGRRQFSVKFLDANNASQNIDLYVFDFAHQEVNTITLDEGRWPKRREIVVERGSQQFMGVQIGDTVTFEMPDGTSKDLTVVGIAHDLQAFPAIIFPVGTGYISFDTLEWMDGNRNMSNLYVIVSEHRDSRVFVENTADIIADRIELFGLDVTNVQVNEPFEHPAAEFANTLTTILAGIGVFSLILSGFLVINTISAILAQQQRQIGMMKSVGARSTQVIQIYLAMVVAFGVLSLLVSVPVGTGMAFILTSALAFILNMDIVNFHLPLWVFGLMVLCGLIVPIISALVPIFAGTRITVREAVSDYGAGLTIKQSWIDRFVEWALVHIRGLPRPVILSLRNTFRRKMRLSLTLLVLTLAGAIFISLLSVRQSMLVEFEKIFQLFNYDLQIVLGDEYPISRLEREALRIEGVTAAESWGFAVANRIREDESESNTITIFAPPPGSPFVIPTVVDGRWIEEGDQNDIILTRDVIKEEPDIEVGDVIELKIDGITREWNVVGIIDTTGQLFAYTNFNYMSKITGTGSLAGFIVVGTEERTPEFQTKVLDEIEDRFPRAGIEVGQAITQQQIAGAIAGQINIVVGFMLVMSVLLAIVGGLGLAGTMSLNVLERTREIGVLRAVGASNWAVSRIVLVEGVVIGLISIVSGAIVAFPMSKIFGIVLGNAFFERPLQFQYSIPGAIIWLALALIIAAIASLAPAWRASRVSVRESLAYE